MNKFLTYIIIILCSFEINAQQVPFYNHYFANPFVINPAYAGFGENVNAFLVRNSRNTNFGGGAVNNYLTVDAAIGEKHHQGIGLMVIAQTHGIQQQYGGGLSYAYVLKTGESSSLRFGVQAGFLDNQIDASEIKVEDQQDPYLEAIQKNKLAFNGSAGLAFNWKNTNIGFSVPQLLGNKVNFGGNSSRGFYQLERHYMFSASQTIFLTKNQHWSVVPNVIVRFSPAFPIQYDALAQFRYKKIAWLSVGYKSNYAVELNAGIRFLKHFQLGYSYELITGSIQQYQSGMNHEIMLGITVGQKQDNRRLEELERQNAQLAKDKQEADRRLRELLEAQNQLKEKMKRDSIDAANALRDSLRAKDELLKKQQEEIDKKIEVDEPFKESTQGSNKYYHFIEMDESDSPLGYYVTTGVFTSRANAENHLDHCISLGYDAAKLVKNTRNNMFYVVILYTTTKSEATVANNTYKRKMNANVWVLIYDNNK